MKVFKGKIWAAIGSLMDHAAVTSSTTKSSSSTIVAPDRALLAAIESAIDRYTTAATDDDRHVQEILFLVSNAPGAITFLSRRITARLESARAPAAALRSLLLVHRLLRAGDRYFEQDLRGLWQSRDLRVDAPRCSCSPLTSSASTAGAAASCYAAAGVVTGACAFVHGYSAYLEERMLWVINQAGNLEPARRPANHDAAGKTPSPPAASGDGGEGEELVLKLAMCQRLLDLAMQLLPDNNTAAGCGGAARAAFGIVVRESFKVYGAFAEGLEAMMLVMMSSSRSLAAGGGLSNKKEAAVRVSAAAHEVLKKACAQTLDLREFYRKCKGSSSASSKSLEYPVVRVVTPAQAAAAMEVEVSVPMIPEEEEGGGKEEEEVVKKVEAAETSGGYGGGGSMVFDDQRKMETTISEVWVEFDEEDKLIPGCSGDGHSLKEPKS